MVALEWAVLLEGWAGRSACKALRKGGRRLLAVGAWLGETRTAYRGRQRGQPRPFYDGPGPHASEGEQQKGGRESQRCCVGRMLSADVRKEGPHSPEGPAPPWRVGLRGGGQGGWRGEKGAPSPGGLACGESGEGPERWLRCCDPEAAFRSLVPEREQTPEWAASADLRFGSS